MKFSEHLSLQLTPEWRSKYIRYQFLKEMIYRIIIKNNTLISSIDDVQPDGVNIDIELEEEFFKEICTQFEEVQLFYKSQEFKLNSRLTELNHQLAVLEKSTKTESNSRYRSFSRQKNDLKFAYKEFYLNLVILQNFRVLNQTGFRKIAKKHDKVIKSGRGQEFMTNSVNSSYMISSREIPEMIDKTEEVVIRLEEGNRKKAMNALRVPLSEILGRERGCFRQATCSAVPLFYFLQC